MNTVNSLSSRAKVLLSNVPTGPDGRLLKSSNARHGLELFVILSALRDLENSKLAIDNIVTQLSTKTGWLHNFLAIFLIVFSDDTYREDTVRKLCIGMSMLFTSNQELSVAVIDDINTFLFYTYSESGIFIHTHN